MVGRDHVAKLIPALARFLKPLLMIVDQIGKTLLPRGDVRPVRMDGNSSEIQLQLRILKGIGEAAMPVPHRTVAVQIAKIGMEIVIDLHRESPTSLRCGRPRPWSGRTPSPCELLLTLPGRIRLEARRHRSGAIP